MPNIVTPTDYDWIAGLKQPNGKTGQFPITLRFWSKVAKTEGVGHCWFWQGKIQNAGYGVFSLRPTQEVLAHRFAYELLMGPIAGNLQVDHLCRNRACVKPAHMELVTSRENTMRGTSFAAVNAAKTHCKYGHPFDALNTSYRKTPKGIQRRCRQCERERNKRFKQKRRFATSLV